MGEILPALIGGRPYAIERGSLPYEIVWELNKSPGADLLNPLGYDPSVFGISPLLHLMNRELNALSRASRMAGRTLIYPDEAHNQEVAGIDFNTFEIMGYAFNPLKRVDQNVSVSTGLLLLPKDDINFRRLSPRSTVTMILQNGREVVVAQEFLFPGACTFSEVVNKAGHELGLWELLINAFPGSDIPFILPIPEYIGKYPSLEDPTTGRSAYFLVNRVPYNGERSGILPVESTQQDLQDASEDAIFICPALKVLHDLGLMHNQMVPGNFYAHPCIGKPYIADLATLSPLDISRKRLGGRKALSTIHYTRGMEMLKIISRYRNTKMNDLEYRTIFFKSMLGFYMGVEHDLIDKCFPNLYANNFEFFLPYVLEMSERRGIFYPNKDIHRQIEHSQEVLNRWKQTVTSSIE